MDALRRTFELQRVAVPVQTERDYGPSPSCDTEEGRNPSITEKGHVNLTRINKTFSQLRFYLREGHN